MKAGTLSKYSKAKQQLIDDIELKIFHAQYAPLGRKAETRRKLARKIVEDIENAYLETR